MKQNTSKSTEVGEFDISVSDDTLKFNPRKRKEYTSASSPILTYIGFASNFGFSIALPLVGALIAGRYIDGRLDSSPKATIVLLVVGLVISTTTFIRVILKYLRGSQKKN